MGFRESSERVPTVRDSLKQVQPGRNPSSFLLRTSIDGLHPNSFLLLVSRHSFDNETPISISIPHGPDSVRPLVCCFSPDLAR